MVGNSGRLCTAMKKKCQIFSSSTAADQDHQECVVSSTKSDVDFEKLVTINVKHAEHGGNAVGNEQPLGTSSVVHTTINLLGIMLGLGLLSTPYALEEGGWMSLGVLLILAVITCYTAFALSWCVASDPKILSYQDIGKKAFGLNGRILVSVILYMETIFIAIGYTISMGDNIAAIFSRTDLGVSRFLHLTTPKLLTIVAIIFVLPTLWIKDLNSISLLSWGGVITSVLSVIALIWAGTFGGVGFHESIASFNFNRLPVSTGLYAFCYAGHLVFPSIYRSMKEPSKFPKVVIVSFITVTIIYGGFACLGAPMFGRAMESQISLNMPRKLIVTKLALWATVLTPMSKFALQLSPVARELESVVASGCSPRKRSITRIVIATLTLMVILLAALALPYFGYVLSLTGSFLSITMSIILPCVLVIKIKYKTMSNLLIFINIVFICVGLVFSITGTISSARNLIDSIHDHGRN